APRSRRSRRCLPSSRALRSATAGGRGGGAVLAVGQLGTASGPDHAALDEGAHVLVLEHLDPVAGGGHEDAAFAPLAGPDRGGGDLAVPRVPLADLLRGGGQHIDDRKSVVEGKGVCAGGVALMTTERLA